MESTESGENLREKALSDLRELRNDYLDEIPEDQLLPRDTSYHMYKCRLTFFTMVRNELLKMQRQGLFGPELQNKIDEFDRYLRGRETTIDYTLIPPGYSRTTPTDIKYVNSILDIFIAELS